jgi:hypothetical protein
MGQEFVKALEALFRRELGQISTLHSAQKLHPFGVEVVKKTHQLKARPVHVLPLDQDLPVSLCTSQHIQLKVLDQFSQFDGIVTVHFHHPSHIQCHA